MVKLANLLMLSSLIIWLAVSGCIGNDASKVNESRIGSKSGESPNYTEMRSNDTSDSAPAEDLEGGLTQTELKELDTDMADLQSLLENSSVGEDIEIESVETGKSENLTKR